MCHVTKNGAIYGPRIVKIINRLLSSLASLYKRLYKALDEALLPMQILTILICFTSKFIMQLSTSFTFAIEFHECFATAVGGNKTMLSN